MRFCRLLALLAVGWLLTGCNPFDSADPMMEEYVERVARVLELDAVYSELPAASNLPRRRDRQLVMPELDMDMLDFLSLYGCELQYVIGEKNSVMGKVMQPLNRLRYELRFIDAAEDCLPDIEREGVKASLQEAVASKKESLPIALWNATWGVEEIETLFTLAKGDYPVAHEGNPVSDLSIDANRLNDTAAQLLAGDLSPSLDYVGGVQQRWQAEHRAGQLINSARLLVARLEDASTLLKQRIDGRPLCIDGKPNNQSDIVQSMFFSVYIEKIQPYMSQVQKAETQLLEPLSQLASMQFPVMPPEFREWYDYHLNIEGKESLWGRLDSAMAEHTRLWQTLLEQCGLRPQA
ncbi:DUF3080 domain-containing protein [Marinobacter sp. CHS3-4]|uniref:DUF3080 domain-containing protein n=1 Tax=Marinobacter sp. CHS3-4 TaxID=3045174 RepID=UPI0024B49E33|nr:DUF3080 domain-containing protein [Marinobacter sp. CHS3-4]MDI9246817.1 DUF3080 domain-containing protein [Marinobacter sp. CHS3-4]